jgi:hypothetical protein
VYNPNLAEQCHGFCSPQRSANVAANLDFYVDCLCCVMYIDGSDELKTSVVVYVQIKNFVHDNVGIRLNPKHVLQRAERKGFC